MKQFAECLVRSSRVFTCAGLLLLPSATGYPQDRVFNYTYQSLVLAPGQRELEVWNTFRVGKESYFRGFDHRIEFEIGIAKGLQTAFYLNIASRSFSRMSDQLSQGPGGIVVVTPVSSMQTETEFSFSNEWKYKLTDPLADPFGIALYGEYSISPTDIELEPKLILDKIVGDVILAFNTAAEFEFEKEIETDGSETTEKEIKAFLTFSAALRVADGLHLGVELVNRNGFSDGMFRYSALFAGPTVSYIHREFWINVTLLPQVTAFKGATQDGLVLNSLERFEARILFSYAW